PAAPVPDELEGVDVALGDYVGRRDVTEVEPAAGREGLADRGQGGGRVAHVDVDGLGGAGGLPRRGGELGGGAAQDVVVDAAVGAQRLQGLERDEQSQRLVGAEAQRAVHAARVGQREDLPVVLVGGKVDEVVGQVAGRAGHPQEVDVGEDLALAHREVGGDVGDGHPGVLPEVGDEGEQTR